MKNKGFTLVEILAVVVILGIIATISIAGVSNIIKSSKERYYEKQEDLVILAGKSYYADHRSKLPYEIGTISSVNVSTLVEQKYIEPVVDVNKQSCSSDTSKVYVQKVTDEEYKYWGYLECNTSGYVSSTDTTKPSISFSPNNTVETSTSQVKVTMTVTDNKQVASYRYVITKDGVEYKDSGYKTYEKTVTIDLTNTGTYTIKGYAYDTSGNKNEQTSGTYTIKITAPDCNAITVTSTTAKNTWINKDITINVTKGSGVEYYTLATNENGEGYKNQIKNSTKNGKIVLSTEGKTKVRIKGYNSESNSCQKEITEYYIDKTKPNVAVNVSGISLGGNTYGINGSNWPTFSANCTDQGTYQSGIASSTVSAESYKNYPSIRWGSTRQNLQVYANCKDKAGNTANQTSKTVNIKTYSRHSSCGVERYNYCRTSACGVESYRYCNSWQCGSYRYLAYTYSCNCYSSYECHSPAYWYGGAGNNRSCPAGWTQSSAGPASYNCCRYTTSCRTCYHYETAYYSCRTSACGVERYNNCRASACGIELYKACYHY